MPKKKYKQRKRKFGKHRDVGERLEAYRLARYHQSMDWEEYASSAGIDAHAYRQNENGKVRISIDNALLLKAKHKITLDWIYAGDDVEVSRGCVEIISQLRKHS